MMTMSDSPCVKFGLGVLFLFLLSMPSSTAARRTPKVIVVHSDSLMENKLVEDFKEQGYSEISLHRVDEDTVTPQLIDTPFVYKLKTRRPITGVYLIPPKYVYLNGSVTTYKEHIDFRIRCRRKSITIAFNRVGYFHLSVITARKSKRERRAAFQENMILSAGMTSSCDNTCEPNAKECKKEDCDHLPRDTIECPPNNNCNIISHDASIYNTSSGPLQQPVGNGVVVKTCDEFISAVCDKFDAAGMKVNVYLDAHGNNGFFVIGEYDGAKEYVTKGSTCYNKICMELKDKISTLTLFSCSTAGGTNGPTFMQCLANCLNANVKAWKKKLYIEADWNTTNVTSIRWSTPRNYTTPCEATPSPSPSPTITPSTPTSSMTPTSTSSSTSTTSSTYTYTSTETSSTGATTSTPTETPYYEDYNYIYR